MRSRRLGAGIALCLLLSCGDRARQPPGSSGPADSGGAGGEDQGGVKVGFGGGVYVASGRLVIINTLIVHNSVLDEPIDDVFNGFLVVFGLYLFGENGGCDFGGLGADSVGLVSASRIV